MSKSPLSLIRGTLDVLILKTLSYGALHGYGVSTAIREVSEEALSVEEGALYPALRRLERRGLLESFWAISDTNREARFYQLTASGAQELEREIGAWQRYVDAMARVLYQPAPESA